MPESNGQYMVSPAEGWDDTEDGYELEDCSIAVREVEGTEWEDGQQTDYTGHSVIVWKGAPGYASPEEIATYEEARNAWELANLLTRLFDQLDPDIGMAKLSDPQSGEHFPNGLADREPEQLLRDVMGYNDFHLDDALEE